MVQLKRYERQKAIDYARAWALGRNPVYHDYEKYGGIVPIIFLSVCIQEIRFE